MPPAKYNMTEFRTDMKYLKDKVQKIDVCLNGDDSNPESLGLVHLVMKNTGFRRRITKVLSATWLAITGLAAKIVYDGWSKG